MIDVVNYWFRFKLNMQTLNLLSDMSSIATAIGVGVAAYQLRFTRLQGVTSFEDSLTERYREVMASLPLSALFGEPLAADAHELYLPSFYRYFDLCNEQAFLHKNGRVSDRTWTFWSDGITSNLRRPAFRRAWNEIGRRCKDDFEQLKLLCPLER